MRIKSLKINDVFRIKSINAEFGESDNIICMIDENENPFEENAFFKVMEILFLDSFYKTGGYLCGNGEIQCFCERFESNFLILLKGKQQKTELVYQGEKMTGQCNGVEEICFCGEKVSGRMQWVLRADYREIFYPLEMREYGKFNGNGGNNGMEEVVGAIETECAEGGWFLLDEQWKILKAKMREYLAEFEGIPFIKKQPLTINQKGELMFQDRYFILDAEEYFSEDEYMRIQFLYWLATLNMIKRLCEDIGRDGDLPVFVENLFENLEQGKDNGLLFEEMRKTGRQIFIFLNKRNAEIEKNCDKILVKGANGEYNIFTNKERK